MTGANTGIGLATASGLARRGARLWLACRSVERGRAAALAIRRETGTEAAIDVLAIDLSDLDSVRAAAAAFLDRGAALDVLVNNAGIAYQGGGITRQGFELHFGVNHLGPFLLTKLLWPRLAEAPLGRVVNVASMAHYHAPGIDWDAVRRPTTGFLGRRAYCVSKLCNILHVKELARRAEGTKIHAYAVHPGVVASDIWRRAPAPLRWWLNRAAISTEEGGRAVLHCAASSEAGSETGLYYDKGTPKAPSAISEDPALARELWQRSEEWTA